MIPNAVNTSFLSVKQDEKVITAFKYMALKGTRAVAVVEENGELVGNISAKDIKISCGEDHAFEHLMNQYPKFSQILTEKGLKNDYVVVTLDNSVSDVVSRLLSGRHHHAYVKVDDKLFGVLTLGDLLRFSYDGLENKSQ